MVVIKATKTNRQLVSSLDPRDSLLFRNGGHSKRYCRLWSTCRTQVLEIRVLRSTYNTHGKSVYALRARRFRADLMNKLYSVKYDGVSLGWQNDTRTTTSNSRLLKQPLSILKNEANESRLSLVETRELSFSWSQEFRRDIHKFGLRDLTYTLENCVKQTNQQILPMLSTYEGVILLRVDFNVRDRKIEFSVYPSHSYSKVLGTMQHHCRLWRRERTSSSEGYRIIQYSSYAFQVSTHG